VANVIELEVTAGAAQGQFNVRVVRSVTEEDATSTMQLDAQTYLTARRLGDGSVSVGGGRSQTPFTRRTAIAGGRPIFVRSIVQRPGGRSVPHQRCGGRRTR
jgi:hypothetical protein